MLVGQCSKCANAITDTDLRAGRGAQLGDKFLCERCAPEPGAQTTSVPALGRGTQSIPHRSDVLQATLPAAVPFDRAAAPQNHGSLAGGSEESKPQPSSSTHPQPVLQEDGSKVVIHYCNKCGKRLAQGDASSGKTIAKDDQTLCENCAPTSPRRDSRCSVAPAKKHKETRRLLPAPADPRSSSSSHAHRAPRIRTAPDRSISPPRLVVVGLVTTFLSVAVLVGIWSVFSKSPDRHDDKTAAQTRLEQRKDETAASQRAEEEAQRETEAARLQVEEERRGLAIEKQRVATAKRQAEEEREALKRARMEVEAEAKRVGEQKKADESKIVETIGHVRTATTSTSDTPTQQVTTTAGVADTPDRHTSGSKQPESSTAQSDAVALIKQEKAQSIFSAVLKDVAPLLADNNFSEALALLERKVNDPSLVDGADLLKQEQADITVVLEFRGAVIESLRKRVGDQVTLKRGNSEIKGKVVTEEREGVTLNIGGPIITVPAKTICADDIDRYALKPAGNDTRALKEDLRCRGLLHLYAGNLGKAKEYLQNVGQESDISVAKKYLDRIAVLEIGEMEAAALKAWDRAEAAFERKTMEEAKQIYDTFVSDYGKTKTAAVKREVLDQRYAAIEKALAPPTRLFSDTFDRYRDGSQVLARWENLAGPPPSVEAGCLLVPKKTHLVARVPGQIELIAEALVKPVEGQDFGLIACHSLGEEYTASLTIIEGKRLLVVCQVVENRYWERFQKAFPWEVGQTYRLRLRVHAGGAECSVIDTATGREAKTGKGLSSESKATWPRECRVGVFSRGGVAVFDQFQLDHAK